MIKSKVVIFHPALAPYRIDFFNMIHEAFDVSFYFEHENPLEQKFNRNELNKRVRFAYSYLSPGLLGIKNLRLSVFNVLRKEKPSLVFISEYNLIGLIVLLYKLIFDHKLKIVITCDDNLAMASFVNTKKKVVRAILIRFVDLVVVVNDQVKNWYEKKFNTKAKFFYFPIIQSDVIFKKRLEEAKLCSEDLREKYGLVNKKVILYVGRLVKVKNVSFLLDAFALLPNKQHIVLVIVGEGEDRFTLEQKVLPYIQDGQIIFVGKKEGAELMAFYNLGEVFVLPSVYEPFGTVVNEALLSGCYVLCSSVAGASCLIKEGKNGSLFDPTDVVELKNKLQQSLSVDSIKSENGMLLTFEKYRMSFMSCLRSLLN